MIEKYVVTRLELSKVVSHLQSGFLHNEMYDTYDTAKEKRNILNDHLVKSFGQDVLKAKIYKITIEEIK